MSVNKITSAPTANELINKVNEVIDKKQNLLSSGENIYIAPELPADYTQLTYLQTSGTQYIDTGITPTVNTGISIDYSYQTIDSSTNAGIVGTYQGTSPRTDTLLVTTALGKTNSSAWLGHRGGMFNTSVAPTANTVYNAKVNWLNNGLMQWEDKIQVQGTNSINNTGIRLFARYNAGNSTWTNASCRIHKAIFTENKTISHYYVPVKRNSDSVLGMYDLVTSTFKPNVGSGTFTAGTEVATSQTVNWLNLEAYLPSSMATDFVKNTDYASDSTGGVILTSSSYATDITDGKLTSSTKTYSDYQSGDASMFVSKGTLENVVAGKGLEALPSQTGNSGKFLTTNGTTTSWATVQGGGGTSRNIGEIVTSSVPLSDPNLHLLDGSLLTSTDYPEFVTAIANIYNTSTQTVTYNVNTVGTITNNNGICSGFSQSNYLKTNVSFKPGTSSWEICVGFTTPSVLDSHDNSIFCKYLRDAYYGLRINCGSYGIYYLISSDQNQHLVFADTGNTTLQTNTDYLLKVSFDGSKYLMQLSTDDGQTWTTDKEVVSSTPMYDWTADTTLGYFAGLPERYMKGSININKAYIKVNGVYIWKGASIDATGFLEESLWQGEVATYGSCGKFVYDSENNTVRLPKIDCILEGTTDTEQRGTISQYLYSTGTNALKTAKTLYYIVVK